jgi:hypothetical protein
MEDTQHETRVAQTPAEQSAENEPSTGATAVAAARMLANPRRIRLP